MKWPGLVPLLARVLSLPFAAVWMLCCLFVVMLETGLEWWLDQLNRKR